MNFLKTISFISISTLSLGFKFNYKLYEDLISIIQPNYDRNTILPI